MSRPVGYRKSKVDYQRQYSHLIPILMKGMSLRMTAHECGLAVNTIRKLKAMFF